MRCAMDDAHISPLTEHLFPRPFGQMSELGRCWHHRSSHKAPPASANQPVLSEGTLVLAKRCPGPTLGSGFTGPAGEVLLLLTAGSQAQRGSLIPQRQHSRLASGQGPPQAPGCCRPTVLPLREEAPGQGHQGTGPGSQTVSSANTDAFHFLTLAWDQKARAEAVPWTCCTGLPGVSNETWGGNVPGVSGALLLLSVQLKPAL